VEDLPSPITCVEVMEVIEAVEDPPSSVIERWRTRPHPSFLIEVMEVIEAVDDPPSPLICDRSDGGD